MKIENYTHLIRNINKQNFDEIETKSNRKTKIIIQIYYIINLFFGVNEKR